MVSQFNNWMENNVSVKQYRKLLSSIPGTVRNNVPLLTDRWSEIKTADHSDLSVILSKYHTWFNCSILKQLLRLAKIETNSDPNEVLSSLQSYTEKMLKYCRRNIFECPPPSGMSSTKGTGTTYFTFKLMENRLSDMKQFTTADEIQLLQANIMILFEIEEYVLQLSTFSKGCVELVYSIPLCIYAELFPLSEDQCRYFTTLGVSEITTKDYHYKRYHVSNFHMHAIR